MVPAICRTTASRLRRHRANEFVVQAALNVPGPEGTPVPAVDFISTMDTDRVAELNMWYHVMNCGLTVRASGETDFPCISGERVGMGRVYVKLDGKLDFDTWVDGLAAGRSYVSDGLAHLMDFTADIDGTAVPVGTGTSRLELAKPGVVRLKVSAAARYPGEPDQAVEVIVNGRPVAQRILKANGDTHDLSFDVPMERSGWVALRAFPGAHTNPFFVTVGGKPIRAERGSALWCLKGIEQCWKMKERTYAPPKWSRRSGTMPRRKGTTSACWRSASHDRAMFVRERVDVVRALCADGHSRGGARSPQADPSG